jgi:ribosomal-protein-serine acetyltransferase
MLAVPPRAELRVRPLETARLMLAPIGPEDANDLWAAIDDSRGELGRWLPWVAFSSDRDWPLRYAEASAQDWDNARACRFTIRERSTRRLVGVVGLETLVHLHQNAELGYWLRTDATGKGYMTEAARLVVKWAFRKLGAHRVRVAAATDNHGSLAVIRRLGFRFEGIARQAERVAGRWLDHAVWGMLATDGIL